MNAQPKLALVPMEPVDIYAAWKAEIAARNWAAVHVAGDRRRPVEVDQRRRGWR